MNIDEENLFAIKHARIEYITLINDIIHFENNEYIQAYIQTLSLYDLILLYKNLSNNVQYSCNIYI